MYDLLKFCIRRKSYVGMVERYV